MDRSPRARSTSVPPCLPRRRTRRPGSSAARSPIVATPYSARTARVWAPTPHRRQIGRGARNASSPPAGTTTRPSGLRRSDAILATSLVEATPTDAVNWASARIAARIRTAISWGGPKSASRAGDVEERFVDRDLLDARREPAEDLHHGAARLAVAVAVDREEGAVRAERGRGPEGHRGPHAEGTRLVAGGADDPARAGIAAHDDRPATKLGPVSLFDRGEERVEVDVQDRRARGRRTGHATSGPPGPAAGREGFRTTSPWARRRW